MIATAIAVAFVVYSCKGKLEEAEKLNLKETPLQVVEDMFVIQSNNGELGMRVEADIMEKYQNDSASYELFPKGVSVYGYAADGELETLIVADQGKHTKATQDEDELWSAFGNVVIQNILKQETIETDTLYWDSAKHEIYTDCYVRMYSPQGFMQGYGMRSDEYARNAILYRMFNTYGVVVQDTTTVVIDSVNFIGPLLK